MIKVNYKDIRNEMKPGDVIAFGGKGLISGIIKGVTNSPVSHVGIIMQTVLQGGIFINQIIESNGKKKGLTGTQVWRMSERLSEYGGMVWWLQMNIKIDKQHLVDFCLSQKDKEYDTPQAIGSAVDFLPDQKEDLNKLFCSELVTAALESVGVLNDINASEATPADVVAFPIYTGICQLKGDSQDIFLTEKTV